MNTSDFTENRFLKLIDNIDQRGTSQSNGVPFSPFRPFKDLSMKERAAVIRIGVQNGLRDLESIRSKYNEYADGGSIHIKPENRGKFTALKKRTGHSASWFKAHGTPAQRKMATFALNSRHWKHGDGGHLYDGESEDTQQMYTGFDWWNRAPMTDYMDIAYEPLPANAPKSKGTSLLDTPIMVQTTPTATTAATFGHYMPKYESTPKRELITLGATVAAPFLPSVGQYGLQAMNTAFTPSTWLNPVTGAKLLSPTVGTIADAGVQGAFAYEGLNGLWNQGRQGTLLSNPASTVMHGLEVLPLVGVSTNAARNIVDPAVRNFDLWKYNVGKRGAESVLRTTNSHNPVPETVGGIIEMAVGKQGGPKRLSNIARYILSGERNGVKGYYNSFAPYNSHSGRNRYFTGFYSDSNELNGKDDLIDAFLYGKDIDPAFGVKKVGAGEGFGVHSKYINDNYAGKASNIPVYELNTIDGIPEEGVAKTGNWYGANGDVYFGTDKGTTLNAAGHMETEGLAPNGTRVIQAQDIWKFHPSNYNAKWLGNPNTAYGKLLRWGLKKVDSYGTPVILRTKWQPAFALGGPLVEYAIGGKINSKNRKNKAPHQVELNARKWKHGDGGILFGEGGDEQSVILAKSREDDINWIDNWLHNRIPQMASNLDAYYNPVYEDISKKGLGYDVDMKKINAINPHSLLPPMTYPMLSIGAKYPQIYKYIPFAENYRQDAAKRVIDSQVAALRNNTNVIDLRDLNVFATLNDNDSYALDFLKRHNNNKTLTANGATYGASSLDGTNTIVISPFTNNKDVFLHEAVHSATHHYPIQNSAILKIFSDNKDNMYQPDVFYDDKMKNYLKTPTEVYSRLMEFRRHNNLDPSYKVTKEDLNRWRKDAAVDNKKLLDVFSDDVLLQLFNDVAHNNTLQDFREQLANQAAFGGPLVGMAMGGVIKNKNKKNKGS